MSTSDDGIEIHSGIAEMILKELMQTPDFMFKGACTSDDLEDYFPIDIRDLQQHDDVMNVCNSCPVLSKCHSYFSELNDFRRPILMGIYGGVDYTDDDSSRPKKRRS